MGIKLRLTILNFLQFFVWGAWLITVANYWFDTKHWDGTQFGAVFGTMGIASIFMPTLMGIIADRWLNAEKLYAILQLLYSASLFCLITANSPGMFFLIMLMAMFFYMPTIALSNSICYSLLKKNGYDVVKAFPPIRVWGTIGFIAAMWITNLSGSKANEYQFVIAGVGAFVLSVYAFFLPKCPTQRDQKSISLSDTLGLSAFKLFANRKLALFFLFSMFLGAALQLTNAYGDLFLSDFEKYPKYAGSFVTRYSTIIMSLSQVSETLFILAIPFFLKKFGIKRVMLISMLAWVLRFGLFGLGNPSSGLWMILLSCVVYGMAFDFFNISGSLFIESSTAPKIRASAQGLFMMMTNGFGAVLGSVISGKVIDAFFTRKIGNLHELATFLDTGDTNEYLLSFLSRNDVTVAADGTLSRLQMMKEWPHIWGAFALYALVIAILFAVFFKHKHDPNAINGDAL